MKRGLWIFSISSSGTMKVLLHDQYGQEELLQRPISLSNVYMACEQIDGLSFQSVEQMNMLRTFLENMSSVHRETELIIQECSSVLHLTLFNTHTLFNWCVHKIRREVKRCPEELLC